MSQKTIAACSLSILLVVAALIWWHATRPLADDEHLLQTPTLGTTQQHAPTTSTVSHPTRSVVQPGPRPSLNEWDASPTRNAVEETNTNEMSSEPMEDSSILVAHDTPEMQRQKAMLIAYGKASTIYARLTAQLDETIPEFHRLGVEIEALVDILHDPNGTAAEQAHAKELLIEAGDRQNYVSALQSELSKERMRIRSEFEAQHEVTWREAAALYEQQQDK